MFENEQDKKLADDIISYRAKNNMSQRAFATKCGVSLQTIYHLESGIQSPSKLTRKKIRLVIGGED